MPATATNASVSATIQRSLFQEAPRTRRRIFDQGIEKRFDVSFVAQLALKEKQIQQNVRPIIAVHKWFARRPGTLFRALLLSEFAEGPLRDAYFAPHHLDGLRIADPFMGGGTPLLEANRLGCDVVGWDVNPMAYWIVQQEIAHLDRGAYRLAARGLERSLDEEVGSLYRTRCAHCEDPEVPVKYFVWVKTQACAHCSETIDLFPGFLLAAAQRHPRNVVICSRCGDLNEVEDRTHPGACSGCDAPLILEGRARRRRCECPHCGGENTYPNPEAGPPQHRMVALEYHCWSCKPGHRGRFFKKPDSADLQRYAEAECRHGSLESDLIPTEAIPAGDETDRLHRWGYRFYREMFNSRQLLGLGALGARIVAVEDPRIRNALATNFSDLLRYQNMLCRYDTRSLKSLDIFSVHGFPVGLIQCESNLVGIQNPSGTNVGSGGWSNIVEKFLRAKEYCDHPFEIRYGERGKKVVPIVGEWIGDRRDGEEARSVELHCGSSTEAGMPAASLYAVLTDPPYFANVQYAELMDFCYVWLRRLVGSGDSAFDEETTHRQGDLTGNATQARGLEQFVAGLSRVYRRVARALMPGRPLVFTYHHNAIEAYYPVAVALLDAGLVCTASLPCPAEMGGSIHIHHSESSIVDTVFVCRSSGRIQSRSLAETPAAVADLVAVDLDLLRQAGVKVTRGDARCVAYGHLVRLAVWRLREIWDSREDWSDKLAAVAEGASEIGSWDEIHAHLETTTRFDSRRADEVREVAAIPYGEEAEIEF